MCAIAWEVWGCGLPSWMLAKIIAQGYASLQQHTKRISCNNLVGISAMSIFRRRVSQVKYGPRPARVHQALHRCVRQIEILAVTPVQIQPQYCPSRQHQTLGRGGYDPPGFYWIKSSTNKRQCTDCWTWPGASSSWYTLFIRRRICLR